MSVIVGPRCEEWTTILKPSDLATLEEVDDDDEDKRADATVDEAEGAGRGDRTLGVDADNGLAFDTGEETWLPPMSSSELLSCSSSSLLLRE